MKDEVILIVCFHLLYTSVLGGRRHGGFAGVGPRNRVRNHNRKINWSRQYHGEIDNRNQLEKQFISLQAFHRTAGGRARRITTGERFEPRILESFEPATQELYRDLPAMIHTRIPQKIHNLDRYQNWQCMKLKAALRLPWPWVATALAEKWRIREGPAQERTGHG
jgi:hypothetical protein